MPNKNISLESVKKILRTEISIAEDEKNKYYEDIIKADIRKELIYLLKEKTPLQLLNNSVMIEINLDCLYGKEESVKVYNSIFNNIYKKDFDMLQKVIDNLISNFEIQNLQIEELREKYNNLNKDWLCFRNILYLLNRKEEISLHQIEILKKLFEKNNISKPSCIIMLEYIRNHNIRCKFDNPKISLTTIRMIEGEFEEFELDMFIDNDTRIRLNKYADSLFDEFTIGDKVENPNEYLDEFTSWMNEDDIEYVLKTTLNNFIVLLTQLQSDMLTGDNYENIEERKKIISMYNLYYYEYRKILNYYNNKFEIKEEIIEPEEEQVAKNNLFFLMSASGSCVEKDLSDVPKEYYGKVKFLLNGFKFQSNFDKYIKPFNSNSHLRGYLELRLDQIRIIYRHLNDNNYLILGLIVKKEDTGRRLYTNVVNRDCNYDISTEEKFIEKYNESEECYEYLMQLLDDNKRKGNR